MSAIGVGLSFCAPPGIVTAEAVRRGFARGYWPALRVELGSLVGDALWATIALIGLSFLVQNTTARLLLGIAGTGLLAYLAWNALRDTHKGTLPESVKATSQGDFAAGVFLSLGNPFAIVFWLGVSGSVISTIVPSPQTSHLLVLCRVACCGVLSWPAWASLVACGRRLLKPAFFRWVSLCCGMLLMVFGLQLLWNTVHSLFGVVV